MSHSPCTTTPPAYPPTTEVLLHGVLAAVQDAVAGADLEPPALITVQRPTTSPRRVRRPCEPRLGLLPLPAGVHPADGLAGLTARPGWSIVGCVAGARARSLEDGRELAHDAFTFLLHRDGTSIAGLPGGPPMVGSDPEGTGPLGIVADSCRRVFGLPTAPPELTFEEWARERWLDRVFADVVADPGASWTWDRITDRHPPGLPTALAGVAWSTVRAEAARAVGIDPDLARWMDDGMFCRELLAAHPPARTLLAELRPLLPPGVHDRLREEFA